MGNEYYDGLYDMVEEEAKKTFSEKSAKYNYSFFDNDFLTIWFDVRRKYDRLDVLIRNNYCKGTLPDQIKKAVLEESEDLVNYAIMLRVFLLAKGSESD